MVSQLMATTDREKFFYVRNPAELSRVVASISKLAPTKEKPYTIKVSIDDETRNNKQNRLSFFWYRFLGNETGHGEEFERHTCKLNYGVPLLLGDTNFNAFYTSALKPLSYEQQLMAMDYVPVTSLMTVKEFAQYLTTIDQESANKGIVLPRPEDLYWEALCKSVSQGEQNG